MDSTMLAPFEQIAVFFGVPWGWILTYAPIVTMIVNSVKSLVPNWAAKVETRWLWPVLNGVASLVCGFGTLTPMKAKLAGSVALFFASWLAWGAVKLAAETVNAKPK